jgi:hypothetical protein
MSTFQYVPATERQKAIMQKFRDKFESLSGEMNGLSLEPRRGLSLAQTKLEESAMWFNKFITKND